MSLVIALAFHAVLGGLCAYQSRLYLEARGERAGLPFVVAVAAAALVGAPCALFLFRFYPAWFVHFFDDPVAWTGFDTWAFALSVGVLASLFLATAAGFLSVRKAIDKMHAPYCAAPAAAFALIALGFAAWNWRRVFFVGDLDHFATGSLRPIWGHMAGVVSLLPLVAGAVAVVSVGRWFSEDRSGTTPPMEAR